MITMHTPVLVLGAGLMGSGVALELAKRGISCTVLERDTCALNRASLRAEGKIHLGIMYANDPSLATAMVQLRGALRFHRIISSWMEPGEGWLVRSTPFHYLVANDSVLSSDALAKHFEAVEVGYRAELAADPLLDYLGKRPERLTWRLPQSEIAAHFVEARFSAAFGTAEVAVDPQALATSVRRTIDESPFIDFRPRHVVRSVCAVGDWFVVEGDGPDQPWRVHARQVVNATWEQRLAIDHQLGLQPPTDLLHRLRFSMIGRLPPALRSGPSVTMVLGRYGDVVIRPDGTAYLAWYPDGLQGWTHEIAPPAAWDGPCRGEIAPELAAEIGASTLRNINAWYPGIGASEALAIQAGTIVARGTTDVDDAASSLHDRSKIGVETHGCYHSVDPGKLTSAPMFAVQTVDRVETLHHGKCLASAALAL